MTMCQIYAIVLATLWMFWQTSAFSEDGLSLDDVNTPSVLIDFNGTDTETETSGSINDVELCGKNDSTDCSTFLSNETESTTIITNESSLATVEGRFFTEGSTKVATVTNETESVNTIVTTELTSVTTLVSTTVPTITELPDLHHLPDSVCSCDVKSQECDINCCCDPDCSKKDRLVFSHCLVDQDPTPDDPLHCYTSNFIYRNNTPFSIVKHHTKGLFCIVTDNLPERFQFTDFPVLQRIEQFDKVLKRRRKKTFTWPTSLITNKDILFSPGVDYKFNSYIWFHSNSSIIPFSLPKSSASLVCDTETNMRYLQDRSHTCLRRLPKSTIDCEMAFDYLDMTSFFAEINLITTPKAINVSQLGECTEEACIKFIPFVCDEGMTVCEENLIKKPKFDKKTGQCINIVHSVNYVIYHNGTQGITQANVYFYLENVPVSNRNMLRQNFKLTFHWAGNWTDAPFSRSGKPGYLVGRPIISGKKIVEVYDGKSEESIALSNDPQDWLTVAKSGHDGRCSKTRLNLLFRQNMRTECLLTLPSDCSQARNKSWETILGENSINITDIQKMNLYISSYGDPNMTNVNSWVPVIAETRLEQSRMKSDCHYIFTGINIKIVYSNFGTLKRPQAKLIGVYIVLNEYTGQLPKDKNQRTLVLIESTISFIDVSKPAIMRFADPPVYEIKLPADFFYPFLSLANKSKSSLYFVIGLLYAHAYFNSL